MTQLVTRKNSRVPGRVRGGVEVAAQTSPVQQLAEVILRLVSEGIGVVISHKQRGKSPKIELLAVMPGTHQRTIEERLADMHSFGQAEITLSPGARRAVEVIAMFQAIKTIVMVAAIPMRTGLVQPPHTEICPDDTTATIAAVLRELDPALYRVTIICMY